MAKHVNISTYALTLDCIVCGERFNHTKHGGGRYPRFCSQSCKRVRLRELSATYRVPAPKPRTACPSCGVFFDGGWHREYCSRRCVDKARRKRRKDAGLPPTGGKRTAAQQSAKSAKRRNAVHVDLVDPIAVFERDRWHCQLCGCKTPRSNRGLKVGNAPELDHILPLSKGGWHTITNVQCACRRCNMAKGSKPLGQMLMFG